jgi:hypothetical protein
VTIVAFALLAPLTVLALSYPLVAVSTVVGLAALAAVGRRVAPRVVALGDGRRTSVPLPGLDLRLGVELRTAEE